MRSKVGTDKYCDTRRKEARGWNLCFISSRMTAGIKNPRESSHRHMEACWREHSGDEWCHIQLAVSH